MNKTPWPETTIFLGAGATANLGLPVTAKSGEVFAELGRIDPVAPSTLKSRVAKTGLFKDVEETVYDLLCWLGDKLESDMADFSPDEEAALVRQFPNLSKDERRIQAVFLREQYDWDCLRRVIQICPGVHEPGLSDSFQQDLLNILDLHLQANKGFLVPPTTSKPGNNEKDRFIPSSRLRFARQMLSMLSIIIYMVAWRRIVKDTPENLAPYIQFFDVLAGLMHEEGLRFGSKFKANDRNFYLFSYAFISLNYDPGLMWLLMNSHRKANQNPPYIGSPASPMKLFLDFGSMISTRHAGNLGHADIWHSVTEPVAQRLNDPEHVCDRRLRIGKFYMPHGCFAWRDCPNCGHVTAFHGDKWDPYSPNIYPPTIIPGLNSEFVGATDEEKAAQEKGEYDALQCGYCGQMTYMRDTPLILQTNFKGAHPFYIEEIQTDMRVCLENTRHVVLLGYTLPPDDIIYRSVLAARKNRDKPVYCSVVTGFNGAKTWMSGSALRQYKDQHKNDSDYGGPTIATAMEIFGADNVRAFTGGIPAVFGEPVQRRKTLELLYPTDVGLDCFTTEGVHR